MSVKFCPVSSVVRAGALQALCPGFESLTGHQKGHMKKLVIRLLIVLAFGVWSLSFGGNLNATVESANGNKMPVWCINHVCEFDKDDTVHTALTSATKDVLLADIIPVMRFDPPALDLDAEESIGDVFIFLGYVLQPLAILTLVGCGLVALYQWLFRYFRPEW